jgi:hypothetical protein
MISRVCFPPSSEPAYRNLGTTRPACTSCLRIPKINKYVFPYRAELELENTNDVLGRIRTTWPDHLGSVYEIVAKEMLWEYRDRIF